LISFQAKGIYSKTSNYADFLAKRMSCMHCGHNEMKIVDVKVDRPELFRTFSHARNGYEYPLDEAMEKWGNHGHSAYIQIPEWELRRQELMKKYESIGGHPLDDELEHGIRYFDACARLKSEICLSCGTINRSFFDFEGGLAKIKDLKKKVKSRLDSTLKEEKKSAELYRMKELSKLESQINFLNEKKRELEEN